VLQTLIKQLLPYQQTIVLPLGKLQIFLSLFLFLIPISIYLNIGGTIPIVEIELILLIEILSHKVLIEAILCIFVPMIPLEIQKLGTELIN
jgi:hypothetical protein